MSKPFRIKDKDSVQTQLQSIMCEVVSAQSALNMYPDPLDKPDKDAVYLSELDGWAKHAMEHLRVIFDDLNKVKSRLELEESKRMFPERYKR